MRALILVDIQNDFLPGGAMAVPEGDRIVPLANQLMERYDLVVATQDWHPENHGSFAANQDGEVGDEIQLDGRPQTLWPVHCVQGSAGAELSAELQSDGIDVVFTKGEDPQVDSYSGFFDNGHRRQTGLAEYLRARDVDEVHVAGLAADYCVKFTVLDALQLGFKTSLILDATRGVNLRPGDVDRAVKEMQAAGARVIRCGDVLQQVEVLQEGRFLRMVRRGGWEFVQRGNAHGVVVIVAVRDGDLLLVEQDRPPAGGPVIELPAGLAGDDHDPHEPLLAAAQRELLEETGCTAARWSELLACYASPGLTDEKLTYFWARDLRQAAAGGGVGAENITCHWVPLDDLHHWLRDRLAAGGRVSNLVLAGVELMKHAAAEGMP